MSDKTYIGAGKVYFREAGSDAGLIEMGNVSKLQFGVEEDNIQQRDYQTTGGGTLNEVRRVKNVTASLTLHELKAENIALMLYGNTTALNAGTVTDEEVEAYLGALSRLAHANPTSVTVKAKEGEAAEARADTTAYTQGEYLVPAVANGYFYKVTTAGTSGGAPPTFPTTAGATVTDGTAVLTCMGKVAPLSDTDYEVRPGGIFFLAASTAVSTGEVYEIDYSYGAEDVIQAFTNAAKEYQLFFEGLNEAQSGKPFLVDAYRVRFGPTSAFDLIADSFGAFELSGAVLKDTTKTGAGVSQFFKATSAQ